VEELAVSVVEVRERLRAGVREQTRGVLAPVESGDQLQERVSILAALSIDEEMGQAGGLGVDLADVIAFLNLLAREAANLGQRQLQVARENAVAGKLQPVRLPAAGGPITLVLG